MRTHYQLSLIACSLLALIGAIHGCGSDTNEQEDAYGGAGGIGSGGIGAFGGRGNATTTGGGAGGVVASTGAGGTRSVQAGAAGTFSALGGGGTANVGQSGAANLAGAAGYAESVSSLAGSAGKMGSSTSVGGGGSSGTSGAAGTITTAGRGATSGGLSMSFFVTSDKSVTGNLEGLVGADARCLALATAAGSGVGTWHAYLSAEAAPENGNQPINARDRIGRGPWYNANGRLIANDVATLHTLHGDAELFVDEHGVRIPGQWAGSPTPVEHDILTGSSLEGTLLAGFTCESWTSASTSIAAQVGHSDGLGPSMNPNPPYDSWNSSHANESCANTAPRGGAGRLYCFLVK